MKRSIVSSDSKIVGYTQTTSRTNEHIIDATITFTPFNSNDEDYIDINSITVFSDEILKEKEIIDKILKTANITEGYLISVDFFVDTFFVIKKDYGYRSEEDTVRRNTVKKYNYCLQ